MKSYSKYLRVVLPLWILGCFVLLLGGCYGTGDQLSEFSFNGNTMGTTYHITIIGEAINSSQRSTIATNVDSLLQEFNHIVSTYDDHSEISLFNRNKSITPIPVSTALSHVVKTGLEFCSKSEGAFDITVMPIVNFFGFGFEPGENRFPNVDELDAWLQLTGCDKIELGDSSITKSDPRISIDLSAIAKGDGVDHVANYLISKGYSNIFVEIGGEIVTHGTNRQGKPWRIGIDRPTFGGAPGADLQHVVRLTDMAIASSGDYRNYREVEGQRISHTIDPRSGSPIRHNLAAVSVIADKCLDADGLATCVMVLGAEQGLLWLESYPAAEGLLITRELDGSFQEYMTSGFRKYLAD